MPEHTPAPTFSRAVYGFVLYLSFNVLFLIYVFWAVVPDNILESLNITYLPQKYWAVAIPILMLNLLAIFVFCIYPGLNLCMIPSMSDTRTFTDKLSTYQKQRKNESGNEGLSLLTKDNSIGNNSKWMHLDSCAGGDDSIPKKIQKYSGNEDYSYLGYLNSDNCTCKSLETCYKRSYDKKDVFVSKRVKDLSSVLHSVPPIEDIHISDVCKTLYLK